MYYESKSCNLGMYPRTAGCAYSPIHQTQPSTFRKQPPHRLETTSIASSSSEVRTESSEILPLKAKMQLYKLYKTSLFRSNRAIDVQFPRFRSFEDLLFNYYPK